MSSVATRKNNVLPLHLEVQGETELSGFLKVSGAKNSSLALMSAALLTREKLLSKMSLILLILMKCQIFLALWGRN